MRVTIAIVAVAAAAETEIAIATVATVTEIATCGATDLGTRGATSARAARIATIPLRVAPKAAGKQSAIQVDPGRRRRVRTRHPAQNKRSARIKRRVTTRHRATTAKRAAASHVPGMPEPVASAPAMSAVSAAGEVGGDAVAVDARVGKTPPIARAQIKG
jgi:hypothetical protein